MSTSNLMKEGDIVQNKHTNILAVVCSDLICQLTGQNTIYYAGMPVLSGAYPENLVLVERTDLPWRQAANRLKGKAI